MKNSIIQVSLTLAAVIFGAATSIAQGAMPASASPTGSGSAKTVISSTSSPTEIAKAALAAHGGDKYVNLKSMVLSGSADLSAPGTTQAITAKFVMVEAVGKFRI